MMDLPVPDWNLPTAGPLAGKMDVSRSELIELCAIDNDLFCQRFFPRTMRQKSPQFHDTVWNMLESNHRQVSLQMFRGSGKTSLCRVYTAKRIAYGLARTILYIGKSEGHAIRSVSWLRKQIEANKEFAKVYGLRPGDKWQDVEAEIYHEAEDIPIWIMAMGMTGSVRGVNRDDFRPDLIVCDDIIDDENASTEEQRQKVEERLYGAIIESLTPASESPDAKVVMLQTPIHRDDASAKTEHDPSWRFARFGIWTPETQDLPIHEQQSSWPERWSSEEVRKEKRAAIARNKLSVFTREKECRITVPELSTFVPTWLKYYDKEMLPDDGVRVIVIDPVPPPSDKQIEAGLENKDYEAISVIQRTGKEFYLVDYEMKRGHDPSWTLATLFNMATKYKPRKIIVEAVAYQRTLMWLIKRAMEQNRVWWNIQEFTDKRNKFTRIVDALNGVASNGHLHVLKEHSDFIAQFTDYPRVSHEDVLETVAIGVADLNSAGLDEEMFGSSIADEREYKMLEFGGCP